ncbi:putative alpha-xylosidase [Bisporella sp. PMI_857]|nr:putative alpha-xylosidase [Bisporella sp. PMI_857]
MDKDSVIQPQFLRSNFPTRPLADPNAIVGGGSHKYRFTVLTDGLIRYEWAFDSQFEDRASSFAINRNLPVPKFRVTEKDGIIEIVTERFHFTYDGQPFSPSGLVVSVSGFYNDHSSVWRYGEDCETLGGTARTLDLADGRIPLGPGVISQQGFSAIDDSKTMLFDSDGFVTTRRLDSTRVDGYLFTYGHDYAGAVKALYALSGNQPLLPRWALGNWWSRYYAYSDKEYLALMDKFEEEKIPLSVAVIDMDWHLIDDPKVHASGKTGWTGYSWNKELFPEPAKFLSELHKRGLKVTLNDHPADGVQSYEDLYPAMAEAMEHSTEHKDPIHFDITDPKFLNAFFDVLHRPLEEQGVDFWWIDWQQGHHSRLPGIDPLWVLNHFHFLDNKINHKRPLTFSRYAGPGSHRYPVGFSGDAFVTWASLAFQPEFTAKASNIGYGWWSHDIGGHIYGGKDDELGTRWVQFGCFSPILRLHSTKSQWNRKEPWTYAAEAGHIMTTFLRLRHNLLPYLYTMNAISATEARPLVRSMYWAYPKSPEAYRVPNQYLFGSELIVIPITVPRDPKLRLAKTKGWLPAGKFVDIFNGVVYDGDREIWISRRLEDYPVFAKTGSIIPLDGVKEPTNSTSNPSKIEILVVVGADGAFELIEDDGSGDSAEEVSWIKTPIKYSQAEGTLTIGPCTGAQAGKDGREWSIKFLALKDPKEIYVQLGTGEISVKPEKVKNSIVVQVGNILPSATATIALGNQPQLAPNNVESLTWPLLADAQIEFRLKEDIWQILSAKIDTTKKTRKLHALEMDSNLRDAMLEYVLADG